MKTPPQGPSLARRWSDQRFPEESLPDRAALRIVASPPLPSELPSAASLDPELKLLQASFGAQLAHTPVAPVDYSPGRATHWLLHSPFETFLEQVVARKLGSIE